MARLLSSLTLLFRTPQGSLGWNWCILGLLLAISFGNYGGASFASLARTTEESSENNSEEESASPEKVELCTGRSFATKAFRNLGSKPLLRIQPNSSSGRAASGTTRGIVYREGHFLPCGLNAPQRC